MANALFDKGREAFLTGTINWEADNIKVALVRGYTVNLATHEYLSDVTGGGGTIVATSGNLASKTATAGVANMAAFTWTAVGLTTSCAYIIVYKDTGVAGTSRLIAYIDTASGLPVTPNGGDITFTPDAGVNHLFKL